LTPGPAQHATAGDAERLLEEFESAWCDGTPPDLARFLLAGGDGAARRQLLEDLVKLDLEYRWRKAPQTPEGPPHLEDYLGRHPELGPPERLSADLIGEEYLARQRWGDRPGHAEYLRRFPRQAHELAGVLQRIDADLQAEFGGKPRASTSDSGSMPELALPAGPAQSVTSVEVLIDALRSTGLLSEPQLGELENDLAHRFTDVRSLARELLGRDWLTAYQVNQILHGRGPDLVLGPYQLLERLGSGSSGWVFKARHKHLQRLVALKVLRRELLSDTELVARFYQEIRGLSRLSHPNVIHAYDAGPIGQTHVLIMEYVPGIDLGRLVQQSGPLPVVRACEYIYQTALGLQHIHRRGLVHRDIKPSNLLLVSGGVVNGELSKTLAATTTHHSPLTTHQIKILDLGLARLGKVVRGLAPGRLLAGLSSASLTPSGAVMMGTPDFLAPEQALDFRQADHRADIYSLGCTLFFLLAGQPPFPGGTVAGKLLRHHQSSPPRLENERSDVPAEVGAAVQTMLAKDPAKRFQTAAAVMDALVAALPGQITPRTQPHPAVDRPATPWPEPLLGTTELKALDAAVAGPPAPIGSAPAAKPPLRRLSRTVVLAVALLISGGGITAYLLLARGPAEIPRPGPSIARDTTPASPRPIDFASGFASGRGLTFNGTASVGGGRLHLTEPGNWKAGSAFTSEKVEIGQFTTEFRFQLASDRTTDGLTFLMHNAGTNAVGPPGGGLGYGPARSGTSDRGIRRSVAVKFDYWNNEGEGDSSTGLYIDGASPTTPASNLGDDGIDLRTDHVFRVQMTYDLDRLRVKITDEVTRAWASQSYKVDIPRAVSSFKAHVGFTGSSGGTTDTPDILSWVFQPQ
jgi:serine/threonine-protein kinase